MSNVVLLMTYDVHYQLARDRHQRLSWRKTATFSRKVFTFSSFLSLCHGILLKTPTVWHRRTPKPPSPSNLQVLCEHLHLPQARQVELEARMIAMAFAVNSTHQATVTKRMLQQMQQRMTTSETEIMFPYVCFCDLRAPGPPSGLLAPSRKQVPKTTSFRNFGQSRFGTYCRPCCFPNRICVHFVGV